MARRYDVREWFTPNTLETYDDEKVLDDYVWRYYTELFSEFERQVYGAAMALFKSRGNPRPPIWYHRRLSFLERRRINKVLAAGWPAFRRERRVRLMQDRGSEIFINRCAECSRVVATPKAQQCLWCGHDWHPRGTG